MDSGEFEAQFINPSACDCPSPPALRGTESFHIFVSYSSCDSRWTQSLITWLESPQCGLLTCYHERDFLPGCGILENMTTCIQRSQKVLLILSQDFVRSRWCLLEANMSVFRDCLERKPVVPVLLEPDVAIPLHLCHITYLDIKDPEFHNKLLKVLCTPNDQLRSSSTVPYQPPSIYNGKALQPLQAVNQVSFSGMSDLAKWGAGKFSEHVPDQLRLVLHSDEKYVAAIRIVNSVSETKVLSQSSCLFIFLFGLSFVIITFLLTAFLLTEMGARLGRLGLGLGIYLLPLLGFAIMGVSWVVNLKYKTRFEMRKSTCQANVALVDEKILMGFESTTKLHLVYVSLDGCKLTFNETFQDSAISEEMFQKALLHFSSGYACCLANRHFPFNTTSTHGHLEGSFCFCQYVTEQLKKDEWS